MKWTGPLKSDMDRARTKLVKPVPPERWPYGPPDEHSDWCFLHEGGLYCDCAASSEEDEWDGEDV